MEGLHMDSRPLISLLQESVGVNLLATKYQKIIERDASKVPALILHIDELQKMHDHLTSLLKDE